MTNDQISGSTRVVAVWGHPISHSRSPIVQNAAIKALDLDWVYVPFDVHPNNILNAVQATRTFGLVGANVTVPLKELVVPLLDSVSEDANKIGSVNTIVNRDGELIGHTTDGAGLYWDLTRRGIEVSNRRVLIWGAGGSARSVAWSLAQHGCEITIANRTREKAEIVAELVGGVAVGLTGDDYHRALASANILINTTTLGMSSSEMPPIPSKLLLPHQTVYDLVYSPSETVLLKFAHSHGCKTINGQGMLVCQGALSLSLWTNRPAAEIPLGVMDEAASS